MRIVYAGVAASVTALVSLDLLNLDHPVLDPVAHLASYLVHGRAGWLVPIFAVAAAAAALALVPHLRHRVAVGVFVAAGGLVAGFVPTQPYGQWDDQSVATIVHGVAGWAAFVAIPVAAWRLRRDVPAWPGLAAAVCVVLLAVGTVEMMGDGPDHLGHVAGLVERLLIAAELIWVLLAARAVRTA